MNRATDSYFYCISQHTTPLLDWKKFKTPQENERWNGKLPENLNCRIISFPGSPQVGNN